MRWVSPSILKPRLKGSLDLAKFDHKNGSGRWCFLAWLVDNQKLGGLGHAVILVQELMEVDEVI